MLAALTLSSCTSAITDTRVQQAVQTSFGNLYELQQQQRGMVVDSDHLNVRVSCDRGAASAARGPGDDWTCNVTWRTVSATTGAAAYSLNVHADGCFTADGDGPADLNGRPTLVDTAGQTVVNPLWAFDSCFPLS